MLINRETLHFKLSPTKLFIRSLIDSLFVLTFKYFGLLEEYLRD